MRARMAYAAMIIPSSSWCGLPSMMNRSLKAPGSISSALATRKRGRGVLVAHVARSPTCARPGSRRLRAPPAPESSTHLGDLRGRHPGERLAQRLSIRRRPRTPPG